MDRKSKVLKFILKYVVSIGLIVLLCMTVFFSTSHMMNIDIKLREAMKARAAVILDQDSERVNLLDFFTEEVIETDEELNLGRFEDFSITGFNHKISYSTSLVMPWSGSVEIIVTDTMTELRGKYDHTLEEGQKAPEFPAWNNCSYRVRLERQGSFWAVGSTWIITEITKLTDVEILPIPTPGPSATILPQIVSPAPTAASAQK